MKLIKSLAAIVIIALFTISFSACEKDASADASADESCVQQDMNEVLTCDGEKNVEVCCITGAGCVYKYDGQEYADNDEGLNSLADALGCTYKKSANYEDEKKLIISNLISLKDRAWSGVN